MLGIGPLELCPITDEIAPGFTRKFPSDLSHPPEAAFFSGSLCHIGASKKAATDEPGNAPFFPLRDGT